MWKVDAARTDELFERYGANSDDSERGAAAFIDERGVDHVVDQ